MESTASSSSGLAAHSNPVICVVTIDGGVGSAGGMVADEISMRLHDDPERLAEEFVASRNLPQEVLPGLALHLVHNFAQAHARHSAMLAAKRASSASLSSTRRAHTTYTAPGVPVEKDGDGEPTTDRDGGGAEAQPPPPSSPPPPVAGNGVAGAAPCPRRMTGTEEELEQMYAALVSQPSSRRSSAASAGLEYVTSAGAPRPPSAAAQRPTDLSRRVSSASTLSTASGVAGDTAGPPNPAASATRAHVAASVKLPRVASLPHKQRQAEAAAPVEESKCGAAKPETFTRLHKDAQKRAVRGQALADRVAATEQAAVEADKRRLSGAYLPGHHKQASAPAAGGDPILASHRLHEDAVRFAVKREKAAVAVRAERLSAEVWVCAGCGGDNQGKDAVCQQPAKGGRAKGADGRGVCGTPRPEEGVPRISAFAKGLQREVRALDGEYIDWAVAKHREDKERRAADARKAEDEALRKDAPFKPTLNAHSLALAQAARIRRAARLPPLLHAVAPQEARVGAPAAGDVHLALYADGMQHKRDVDAARLQAPNGCTFQPHLTAAPASSAGTVAPLPAGADGGDKGVGKPVVASTELFERLYAEGAAARARLEAARERASEAVRVAAAGKAGRLTALPASDASRLYQVSLQRAAERHAALQAHLDELDAAARSKHVTGNSERMLTGMRKRALVGVYRALVASQDLTQEHRCAIALHLASTDEEAGRDGAVQLRARQGQLTHAQLAALVAAVDAYAEDVSDGADARADGGASGGVLDPAACWSGVLDPVLAPFVDAALHDVRVKGGQTDDGGVTASVRGSTLVPFPLFCDVLGRLLEEAGGGPHLYIQARKQRRAAHLVHEAAAAAAAQLEELTFAPALDPRSLQIVEAARARSSSWGGHAQPHMGTRDHCKLVAEFDSRKREAELDALRRQLATHPFAPASGTPFLHALADPAVRAALASQRESQDLAGRAKAVMRRASEAFAAGATTMVGHGGSAVPPAAEGLQELLLPEPPLSLLGGLACVALQGASLLLFDDRQVGWADAHATGPRRLGSGVSTGAVVPRWEEVADEADSSSPPHPLGEGGADENLPPPPSRPSGAAGGVEPPLASAKVHATRGAGALFSPSRFVPVSVDEYGYTPDAPESERAPFAPSSPRHNSDGAAQSSPTRGVAGRLALEGTMFLSSVSTYKHGHTARNPAVDERGGDAGSPAPTPSEGHDGSTPAAGSQDVARVMAELGLDQLEQRIAKLMQATAAATGC